MTNEEYRKAGLSHLEYFRELLERNGDEASLALHADHLRALLAAATPTAH
ncbi:MULTISPECIES: hypothetical protein [unclassified Nitrobacter]|nr:MULTISPECIES: hypothetical protein [unclassified Nitrobacter]MBN9147177.1 hypothetical protein [Nitrobacter sp.]